MYKQMPVLHLHATAQCSKNESLGSSHSHLRSELFPCREQAVDCCTLNNLKRGVMTKRNSSVVVAKSFQIQPLNPPKSNSMGSLGEMRIYDEMTRS